MSLSLSTLNSRRLRDPSKRVCLLGELSTLSVDIAAVQKTYFTCAADCRVLERDFVVLSAYGSRSSARISLLVGHSLEVDVNIVFTGDGGQLVVADVAVKSFMFRVVAVYVLNITGKRLAPFRDDPKRLVLVGDWNAILAS